MNKELQDKLINLFPVLYGKNTVDEYMGHKDVPTPFSIYKFEIGKGWYSLIYDLSWNITLHNDYNEGHSPTVQAIQVKEKLGKLKFYVEPYDEEVQKWITETENKSEKICEVCGKEGKLRGDELINEKRDGWYRTRCEEHIEIRTNS
jgi:hypothetical protein